MDKRVLVVHGGNGSHGHVVTSAATMRSADGCESRWVVKWTDDKDGTRPDPGDYIHVAIGDNRTRKRVLEDLAVTDCNKLITVIHPRASVNSSARIGWGTFIADGARVNVSARVGKSCVLNTNCTVDHDNIIADYCHISPGAILCGTVTLGEGVWCGANATIANNITVAPWTVIGCGAVVIRDITQPGTYVGNPARLLA